MTKVVSAIFVRFFEMPNADTGKKLTEYGVRLEEAKN
jgi:hypothetical protein